nr:hypothetical protein [Bacteroidota bacterium]
MKRIVFCLMAACLSLTFIPLQLNATTTEPTTVPAPKPAEPAIPAEAKALLLRLDEIKAKDMPKLEASEKKELRKEVKSIKHELRTIGGGVYLSGGALILIIILLVILL